MVRDHELGSWSYDWEGHCRTPVQQFHVAARRCDSGHTASRDRSCPAGEGHRPYASRCLTVERGRNRDLLYLPQQPLQSGGCDVVRVGLGGDVYCVWHVVDVDEQPLERLVLLHLEAQRGQVPGGAHLFRGRWWPGSGSILELPQPAVVVEAADQQLLAPLPADPLLQPAVVMRIVVGVLVRGHGAPPGARERL